MNQYLIDVNLSHKIKRWQYDNYLHQRHVDPTWDDSSIWEFAKLNEKIIITQDCDFSNRMVVSNPPPKVIHIEFGNMKLRFFEIQIEAHWDEIEELIQEYKLLKLFTDRIEAIF